MAELDPLAFARLLLSVGTAGVYGYVGWRLAARRVEGEPRLAWTLFRHWWYGLAAISLINPLTTLAREIGVNDGSFYLTLTYVTLLLLVYVLWALLYYLLYLFTGRRWIIYPVTAFYVAYYVYIMYLLAAAGLYYDEATRAVETTNEIKGAPLAVFTVLLVGPHIVGAIGYFTLYFRTRESTQRYRIGLIAWSIIAWFSTALVGAIPVGGGRLSQVPGWPVFTAAIGLAAAFAILAAYMPPEWVRSRWNVQSIDERAGPR